MKKPSTPPFPPSRTIEEGGGWLDAILVIVLVAGFIVLVSAITIKIYGCA